MPTLPPRPGGKNPLAARVVLDDQSGLDITEAGTKKRLAIYLVRDPQDVPVAPQTDLHEIALGVPDRVADQLAEHEGRVVEPVAFAARTCVASSQYGDVTSWPWGGYQIVVPVYDQVRGNQYHVWGYLGFHVMGVTAEGGLWGFSTGKATTQGTPETFVRLTT